MNLITRLSLHHGLHGFSLGLFMAVQTLFLLEKGLPLTQIALLFGTYGLSAALFELPLGALADLHGRIRVFRWALVVAIFSFALAALINTPWLLFPLMVLLGLSRALESGTIDAWQVEQINALGLTGQLGQLAGRFQALNAAGIGLGAVLGGYLPGWLPALHDALPPTANNLLCVAALLLLELLLLPALFREGERAHAPEQAPTLSEQIRLTLQQGLRHPALQLLFLVALIFGLTLAALEIYWQPFVRQIAAELGYEVFGWLALGYFAAAAVGPALFASLLRFLPLSARAQIGLIMSVAAPLLFLLALQTQVLGFALCYVSFMAVFASVNIPVQVLMNDHVRDEMRSTLFSSFSLTISIGGAVSAYGLSSLVSTLGISGLWQIGATLVAITALILLLRRTEAVGTQS